MSFNRDKILTAIFLGVLAVLATVVIGCGDKGVNSQGGDLTGYVYRAGTSQGVFGVEVSCAGIKTMTIGDGSYTLTGISGGTHTLTARKTDYEYFSTDVTVDGPTTKNIYITYSQEVKDDGDTEE